MNSSRSRFFRSLSAVLIALLRRVVSPDNPRLTHTVAACVRRTELAADESGALTDEVVEALHREGFWACGFRSRSAAPSSIPSPALRGRPVPGDRRTGDAARDGGPRGRRLPAERRLELRVRHPACHPHPVFVPEAFTRIGTTETPRRGGYRAARALARETWSDAGTRCARRALVDPPARCCGLQPDT